MLITLIYINIKCLSLITELSTIETKVKKGYEAAGVIFCVVDHIVRNLLKEVSGAAQP